MKKRILSMLLALVMVLSMVPVQALAEEAPVPEEPVAEIVTEESVAEETEITEATETTGETEATETTETTEETEVTETTEVTEETVVEETTEATEVALESAEAEVVAGAPVEVFVVPEEDFFEGVLSVDGKVTLKLDIEDEKNARYLYWWSDDTSVAVVDNETGVVTGVGVGQANIYVKCQIKEDGKFVDAQSEAYPITVVEKELPRYRIVLDEDNPTQLIGGNSITLGAHVERLDEDDMLPLPTIIWKLYDAKDTEYVTLEYDGTMIARADLTHKRVDDGVVDESVKVQVCFLDERLNEKSKTDPDLALPYPVAIDVYPRVSKIELGVMLPDGEGTVEDGETFFNLNSDSMSSDGITITAALKPEGETISPINWQVNDSKKLCTYNVDDNGDLNIKARDLTKTGTVTVIARASDGSGVSEKIVVRFEKLPEKVEILNLPPENTMRGLSTVKLTTNVASMKGLSDKTILWKVVDATDDTKGTPYARIDTSGNFTANRVDREVSVKVIATTRLGGIASDPVEIKIVPAVESVEITYPDDLVPINVPYNYGTIFLSASVEPSVAIQTVTWSSSNANIAAINRETGEVTIKNSGKVRITATSTDGSKKTAHLYLTITKPVYEVQFDTDANPIELRSGKSFNMEVTAWTDYDSTVKAANQKFTWQVFEDDPIEGLVKTNKAVITSSGRLSVKDITENTDIVVCATSKEKAPDDANPENLNDDGYAYAEYRMTIKPKNRYNFLLYVNGENVTGKTVSINNNDYTVVTGKWYDSGDVDEPATWEDAEDLKFYSSSKSVATIDEDYGDIETLKTGSTTITVKGRDGSGVLHTAKFTLKVTNLVSDITIAEPKSTEVRSGSSLTLKATTWTDLAEGLKATNQKVTWSITDENGNPTDAATISSSGTVKAKTVTKDEIVKVTATAVENGQEADILLTIRPKAQYTYSLGFLNWNSDGDYDFGTVTVPYNYSDINKDDLRGNLQPFGYSAITGSVGMDDSKAGEDVTWSTSSKSIVSIEKEDGALKVQKPGKVTITAKKTVTINGKKTTVSAKITLNLVIAVESVKIEAPNATQKLYAGKKLSLRATLNEGKTTPSNRRLKWWLAEGDTKYATINSSSGVITANREVNKEGSKHTITVYAEPVDGYDLVGTPATITVDILPTTKQLTTLFNGSEANTKDKLAKGIIGQTYTLSVSTDPVDASDNVKWTSSNTSVASIKWDSVENAYVLTAKKKGKATITAAALDGSGKTAKFIINVSAP